MNSRKLTQGPASFKKITRRQARLCDAVQSSLARLWRNRSRARSAIPRILAQARRNAIRIGNSRRLLRP